MTELLRRVQNSIIGMITRCTLGHASDQGGIQRVSLSAHYAETMDECDRIQNYGLTSRPLPGAQGIIATVGGMRDGSVVIAMDDRRYRLKLAEGEVALYDDQGQSVVLKRGRIMEINTDTLRINASTRIEIDTPEITNTGDYRGSGDVSDGRGTVQSMRDTYNGHDHNENNSSGPTDGPNQEML